MIDFFISYNKADLSWAEWIAWQLEEAGYSTVLQAWDFHAGQNFVLKMQRAIRDADTTIAILSPSYLESRFAQPEWAAAFARDPTSEKSGLLPVRVKKCGLGGLLPQIIYIDLVGLDEAAAKHELLAAIQPGRSKPDIPPSFPGAKGNTVPEFPGVSDTGMGGQVQPKIHPTWIDSTQMSCMETGNRASYEVPYQLPPRVDGFIGRLYELKLLKKWLREVQSRASSAAVIGVGGVGKSALVSEAVHRLAGQRQKFDAGIIWIRCDDRHGLEGLIWLYDWILATLNYPSVPDATEPSITIEARASLVERNVLQAVSRRTRTNAPAERHGLLVLDNVEVDFLLSRTVDIVRTLGFSVLLTARHEPTLPHTRIVRLAEPDSETAVELVRVRFINRGGNWNAASDTASAQDIAERLGRLPLAVELAVARATRLGMTLHSLQAELQQVNVLHLLSHPLDRTTSVQYAFERSLSLLLPTQRARFSTLGLLEGPDWPRAVIEGLFNSVTDGPSDVDTGVTDIELLSALSLINETAIGEDGEHNGSGTLQRRVYVHPLLREQARLEWEQQPAHIHKAVLIGLVDAISKQPRDSWTDSAAVARDELLIVGTVRRASEEQISSEGVTLIVCSLLKYFIFTGRWKLGTELHETALEMARAVRNSVNEACILNNLGLLKSMQGDKRAASNCFNQALQLMRETDELDADGEAALLDNLGAVNDDLGDTNASYQYFSRALLLRRETGDQRGISKALCNLGRLLRNMGQPEEATQYLSEGLDIVHEIGDRQGEGTILNNLGKLAEDQGSLDKATAYFEQALTIAREVEDLPGEGLVLSNLGIVTNSLGLLDKANRCFGQSLRIRRKLGDQWGEADVLLSLGLLKLRKGNFGLAERLFDQALKIAQRVSSRRAESDALNDLGLLKHNQGLHQEALRYYEKALDSARAADYVRGEATTLYNLGKLTMPQVDARSYLEEALKLARRMSARDLMANILSSLGAFAISRRDWNHAVAYYRQALTIWREVEDLDSQATCLRQMAQGVGDSGDLGGAIENCQTALKIAPDTEDKYAESAILNTLGKLARENGQPKRAWKCFNEGLILLRETSDYQAQAWVVSNMADVATAMGMTIDAKFLLEEALRLFRVAEATTAVLETETKLRKIEMENPI